MEATAQREPVVAPAALPLPRSSTRLQKPYAHVRVLTEVRLDAQMNAGFEGRIYASGAVVPANELGPRPVALECVGPEHPQPGRVTPVTWILWAWDGEWRELARACATNWEWALVLRRPAWEALHPRPAFYDVMERGRAVAGELMEEIAERLNPEPEDVRQNALASLYDQVAGRMAAFHFAQVRTNVVY